MFYSLSPGKKVTFLWIPAHCGIVENEEADTHAKESTRRQPIVKRIPFTDQRNFYKKLIRQDHEDFLIKQGCSKGKIYFQRHYSTSNHPWFKELALDREIVAMICRCRGNHYSLNESLKKNGVVDTTACECGYDPQDLNHVIWQCTSQKFQELRSSLVGKLMKLKQVPPYDINPFLSGLNIQVMQLIFSYLKKCDVKPRTQCNL